MTRAVASDFEMLARTGLVMEPHMPRWTDRIWANLALRHAAGVYRDFLSKTADCRTLQENLLLQKVCRNATSRFGQVHGFSHIRNVSEFRRQVPLCTYDDLSPYINQVKKGDFKALFNDSTRVRMFALTSGTTQEPKYIPVTDEFIAEYRRGWNAFGFKAVMDHPDAVLRGIVQVVSPMDESRTEAGIPCGSISGLLAQNQMRLVRRYYVVPPVVAQISDATARYYTIMRLAAARDVAWMVTASPATQLKLAKTMSEHGEQIIRDVRDGTLWSRLDIPDAIRQALIPQLARGRERAPELEQAAATDGRLLPRNCWNLSFLANWMGGTLGLYLREFPDYFGQTPVRDIGLLASEGRMSIPVADHTSAGILDITSHFYEFLPYAEGQSEIDSPLGAHEVRAGNEYSLVITTSAGFYRYNLGDVVRVVGFQGATPIIEFLHRGSQVSSMSGEKLTEQQAVLAFQQFRHQLQLEASLFVLAPHWADPPYYCLHLESGEFQFSKIAAAAKLMDQALAEVSIEYASKRKTARLGPVRINLLPAAFLSLQNAEASARVRKVNEQFKHRFLLTQPDQDRDFPSSILASPTPLPVAHV